MIKNQTLWFLSRLGVVVADGGGCGGGASFRNCRLISSFGGGSMALFNTKGYGFSQVGGAPPPPNEILRPRINPQSPLVGLGKGRTSINACHWLSLKSYSHRSAASSDDGTGNGFQNPPRAFAPYPQLRHYSGVRLDEGKKDTKFLVDGPDVFQRGNPLGFLKHSLPEKLVVAVDVDEVLGSFVSALNKFIADRYSSNHSVSEYHVYEFYKIWNCSRNEADIRVHEFFKTSYFKTGIHPIPGARVILHKLSTFCNLSVVTSRQNAIKDHTIEWIEKHYPGLFKEIHFGNHFALDGTSRPKSEICRCLGAQVLIDDNPRYAIECAEAGIRVLLFDYENSYPWCKTESDNLHPLITKVHNWEEVEHQLVSCITP